MSSCIDGNVDLADDEDDFAGNLGRCPPAVWSLNDPELQLKLFTLVEKRVLLETRALLRDTVEASWGESDQDILMKTTRALSLCYHIIRALTERGEESGYLGLQYHSMSDENDMEDDLDVSSLGSIFDEIVAEFRLLEEQMLERIRRDVLGEFKSNIRNYTSLLLSGGLQAPETDGVLAYDASPEICSCTASLQSQFQAIASRVVSAKMRALIWKPIVDQIDEIVVYQVLMLMFTEAPTAPQAFGDGPFPEAEAAVRTIEQVAYDIGVLVDVLDSFTRRDQSLCWRTTETLRVLRSASELAQTGTPEERKGLSVVDVGHLSPADEEAVLSRFPGTKLGAREIAEILSLCGLVSPAGLRPLSAACSEL
eukprot:Plantae.Rhodophyta-Rhodochaete_pulchella.ctg2365.p1 GENE.Plantae.Rhodophyta-Rhodochaete_pulchella.ctg2365~~Plantae.Rhodophyta-Rhodochaete_pulchella.ctg2365.p1  ORF type:complete len:367 (-),score=60.78 Plantae.Rhodophyta-Rhodochaete_pulchella.ctg2365:837-1937(-)